MVNEQKSGDLITIKIGHLRGYVYMNCGGCDGMPHHWTSWSPEGAREVAHLIGIRSLNDTQLLQALKNVGCDLECDACAAIFFTGARMHEKHTCPKSGIVAAVASEREACARIADKK